MAHPPLAGQSYQPVRQPFLAVPFFIKEKARQDGRHPFFAVQEASQPLQSEPADGIQISFRKIDPRRLSERTDQNRSAMIVVDNLSAFHQTESRFSLRLRPPAGRCSADRYRKRRLASGESIALDRREAKFLIPRRVRPILSPCALISVSREERQRQINQ